MARSFRFVPPEARADLLTRPRLLRALTGRWQHRVTSVVGGPGLGKTTLLAQAIAENKLAPRGDDVWVGVERQDADADRFARVVAAALSGRRSTASRSALPGPPRRRSRPCVTGAAGQGRIDEALPAPDPASVADAMWQRSPTETCLVLDDVHLLPPDLERRRVAGRSAAQPAGQRPHRVRQPHRAAGAAGALPGAGHGPVPHRGGPALRRWRAGRVRRRPGPRPRPLRRHRRLAGHGRAHRQRRAQRHRQLPVGGGARTPRHTAPPRASPCSATWAAPTTSWPPPRSARPVDLDRDLAGVPLVARDADGWYVPHALWRTAPRIGLDPGEATGDPPPGDPEPRRAGPLRGRVRARRIGRPVGRGAGGPARRVPRRRTALAPTGPLARRLPRSGPRLARRPAGRRPPRRVDHPRAGRGPAAGGGASCCGRRATPMPSWWRSPRSAAWPGGGSDLDILAELAPRVHRAAPERPCQGQRAVSARPGPWPPTSPATTGRCCSCLAQVPPGTLDPTSELLSGWFRGAMLLYSGDLDAAAEIADGPSATRPSRRCAISPTPSI